MMGIDYIWRPEIFWRRTLKYRGEEDGETPADHKTFQDVNADPEKFANAKEAEVEQED